MNRFRIFETERFAEDLQQDFEGRDRKIKEKLKTYVYPQLRVNPYFGNNIKKLKDYTPDTWRYRVGDYRFFYELDEQEGIVYMIAAEARKDSYR